MTGKELRTLLLSKVKLETTISVRQKKSKKTNDVYSVEE